MEKVTGIGGFFIRSADPVALSLWYEAHLGVLRVPARYEAPVWEQEAGPLTWLSLLVQVLRSTNVGQRSPRG